MVRWFSRVAAVPLVVVAALLLSSCSLFAHPTATVSDVVGAWKSDQYDAALVLRDDMTFDVRNVPVGYVDLTAVDLLDPQTDRQKRLTFSGTWKLDPPNEYVDYATLFLLCATVRPGLYAELSMRFSGDRLSQLYLTQGDPDSDDFLSFFPDSGND